MLFPCYDTLRNRTIKDYFNVSVLCRLNLEERVEMGSVCNTVATVSIYNSSTKM